eukprot:4331517-Amphidinium_carterae.1
MCLHAPPLHRPQLKSQMCWWASYDAFLQDNVHSYEMHTECKDLVLADMEAQLQTSSTSIQAW